MQGLTEIRQANASAEDLVTTLERLVDVMHLQVVAETLATVCREKADHVRTNWQDERLAERWDNVAISLEQIVNVTCGM